LDFYFLRLSPAQHDVSCADADVQRAGEAALADNFDAFADAESKRGKAVGKGAVSVQRSDSGGRTGFESFQVNGSHVFRLSLMRIVLIMAQAPVFANCFVKLV
jgi:hypothetical protein